MAGTVKINWFGKQLDDKIRREVERRLATAAAEVTNQVKVNISEPTRAQGPSLPGEFPHADTGLLRNSIFWEMDTVKLEAIVGTSLKYGLYLEYGTEKMEARPFLRQTLAEMGGRIQEILNEPIS